MPRSTGEGWLNVNDAARELGIVNRTLYRMIDQGLLVAYRMGRVIRIRRTDLEAYVEAQRIEPGSLRHLYYPWVDDEPDEGDDEET